MRVRVVTWNVHSCVGADGRHDPLRTAAVLAGLGADVIGLQEVDWRHPRVAGRDPLELLSARLGLRGVAGPNLRDHRGDYGNALLTRFEVEEVRRHSLSHGGREPRGAIDALLRAPDGPLRVLVTHLGLKRIERRAQAAALHRLLDASEPARGALPTVLLGDLNDWRPVRLRPHLLVPDPFPAFAAARTYPARLPALMLDRILVRPSPARLDTHVVRTPATRQASDHLPLVADVEW
jgi:endonuclease/exonuclease/phosphatase family metal-dependent hydrolase